jgi:hypothetical protein
VCSEVQRNLSTSEYGVIDRESLVGILGQYDRLKVLREIPPTIMKGTAMAVRKVNLSELKGTLNKRGRGRYEDPELKALLIEMLIDGEPLVYDELFIVTSKTTNKQIDNEQAKWRNRAVSVFESIKESEGHKLSITWTDEQEMIISLAN